MQHPAKNQSPDGIPRKRLSYLLLGILTNASRFKGNRYGKGCELADGAIQRQGIVMQSGTFEVQLVFTTIAELGTSSVMARLRGGERVIVASSSWREAFL